MSDNGRRELARLCENFDYPYVDRVYTSPMMRARETANILYPESDYRVLESLNEAALGRFSGHTIFELEKDEEYRRWVAPNSQFTPDGIEPPAEFSERCCLSVFSIIKDLMADGLTSAAVITHSSVILRILSQICLPKMPPYEWRCDFGMGYKLGTCAQLIQRDGILEVMGVCPTQAEDE